MSSQASALSSGLALIGLQLLSRLLTFSLNQALVRLTTPQALGVATIQFEVLLNTALFLSREGVRGALVRTASSSDGSSPIRAQQTTNATFLPLVIGVFASITLFGVYHAFADASTQSQPHFASALAIYLLATLLELIAEPLFIRSLVRGDTRLRVRIEGFAVIAKTCTTLAVVLVKGETWGLLAFAIGQAVYGFMLTAGFWLLTMKRQKSTYLPRRPTPEAERKRTGPSRTAEPWFDAQDLSMSWALTRQSLVKQFLSEGDKVIVGRVCPVEDQGGYALALNYGSLVARILFQPVEETARIHFSKTVGVQDTRQSSSPSASNPRTPAARLLSSLLFVHAHLSLIFITFGPPHIPLLLSLLLGRSSRFFSTSAPRILSAYCFLLPLLGVNGVLEAFVQAVATEKELGKMGRAMLAWSGVFVAAAWVATRTVRPPAVGMVIATAVNMVCRIAWAGLFAQGFFRLGEKEAADFRVAKEMSDRRDSSPAQEGIGDFLPNRWTIAAFAVAAQVVRWSASRTQLYDLRSALQHLVFGALGGVGCLAVIATTDRHRLRRVLASIRGA